MDPQELIRVITALDQLVETATKETVNNRDFDGQKLLDFIGEDISDYWDTLPREDGLLVYGPYDLEELVGAGRGDLNLVIDALTDEAGDIITGFRLQIMDQSSQAAGGPNMMRPEIDEIFIIDLGEFSTKEEMENLFTKTTDIDGATAKVSLVGDKLDEIFPNSTASIEMALTNKGPVISDRLRRDIGREFLPPYAKAAFEKVDAEQAAQYAELTGDVEVPDTVEAAAADVVPDDISQINLKDDVQKLESELLKKYADVLEFDESVFGDIDNKSPLSLNYYDGKLNIDIISVAPASQNQGVGRNIVNEIIAFANANNLEIRVDSLADEFFEKMGFENFADEQGFVDEAVFRKLPDTSDVDKKEDKVMQLLDDLKEKYGEFLDNTASEAGDGSGLHFDLTSGNIINGDEIYIEAFYLKPEAQGKGIGKKMVNDIKKLSDEINVPITLLDKTLESPYGSSFWKSMDFDIDDDTATALYNYEGDPSSTRFARESFQLAPDDPVDSLEDDVAEVTNDYVKKNWQDHKRTADGIVMRINDQGEPEILLIKRKRGPHRDGWALPGGIIDEATEKEYDRLAKLPSDQLDWQGKDRAFFKTYQRGPRGIYQYTILKELIEETGLPVPELDEWYDNKYLGTKVNRFDWDARATNGVDVGGHFYFMSDNTWEPTASDDAVQAEWKSLKSILDGDTTLAFGHGEWIEDILTDNQIINNHLSILFDDNPAYLYGVNKPDNTLGTYQDVLNKIKSINETNKSNITELINAVNVAREEKGMDLIPVDNSNILGSKEKLYKELRLNDVDPDSVYQMLSTANLERAVDDYLDKYTNFTFDYNDFDETELIDKLNKSIQDTAMFEGISDPEKINIENIINPSSYDNPRAINGGSMEISVNANGKQKIAKEIQNNVIIAINKQVEFIKQNSTVKDPIFLKEWADNYIAVIQKEEFLNEIVNLLDITEMKIFPMYDNKTNTIRFNSEYVGRGIVTDLNVKNGGLFNTIHYTLNGSNSQQLVDDVFEGFNTETPVDFFLNNADMNNTLNQKGAYIEDGKLFFQTNHGSSGPTEEVLELLKNFQDKYGDDPNIGGIADDLKESRGIFFDPSMKFIDPNYTGSSGLVGAVFYTTTNPFVGAGYAQGNADGTTITGMATKIENSIINWLKKNYVKGNDQVVNEFIEEAKKIGILINVEDVDVSAFSGREDIARSNAKWTIKSMDRNRVNSWTNGLSAGTISNIEGSVNIDNVLPLNQSMSAGKGNPKARAAFEQVLDMFGENWWSDQLQNGKFIPPGLFVAEGGGLATFSSKFISLDQKSYKPTLQNGFDEYAFYDRTRPIPGAPDVSTPEKWFRWSEKNVDGFFPMFNSILGFSGNKTEKLLTGRTQRNYNYQKIQSDLYDLFPVESLDPKRPPQPRGMFEEFEFGDRTKIADYLDSVHHYFGVQESLDIQEIANLLRVSEALIQGNVDEARKLAPELIIPDNPQLFDEFAPDVDTDEALYRSQFSSDIKDITNAIDKHFFKYLDIKPAGRIDTEFSSLQNMGYFRPNEIFEEFYESASKPGKKFIEEAIPFYIIRGIEEGSVRTAVKERYTKYLDNYRIANNIKTEISVEDLREFIATLDRFSLTAEISGGDEIIPHQKTDNMIFRKLAENGYEIVLSTGGGSVGATPHYMIGIIDPGNKMNTGQVKTLDIGVVNTAFMNSQEAQQFEELVDKNINDYTDSDMRLITKYMDPTNIFEDIDENKVQDFIEVTKNSDVAWSNNIGVTNLEEGRRDVSIKLLMLDEKINNLHVAHQTGQIPIEPVLDAINEYVTLLATASEDVRAKILTGTSRTLNIVNKYAKRTLGGTIKYGGKALDKFDKYVLLPAAVDILGSRLSGAGSQYETIGGALADTMSRYEDDTPDTTIEMLYGNKNNPDQKNLIGINIAKPVTDGIQVGKDIFKEYVYDNNILGIQSLVEFIKPKALEELKGIVNLAGLNDWVYKVKRDLVVESIMNSNNIPYTKENIDIYTKAYEENNPREVDRFGQELPGNYENNWSSSIPDNYLSRDFRIDERIRRGDRYRAGGGGTGVLQE